MPKHKHMLDVLLEDRWIDIQDENLLTHMLLSESSLCVAKGDDKATMNSSSEKKITILCLYKSIHFQLIIQNNSNLIDLRNWFDLIYLLIYIALLSLFPSRIWLSNQLIGISSEVADHAVTVVKYHTLITRVTGDISLGYEPKYLFNWLTLILNISEVLYIIERSTALDQKIRTADWSKAETSETNRTKFDWNLKVIRKRDRCKRSLDELTRSNKRLDQTEETEDNFQRYLNQVREPQKTGSTSPSWSRDLQRYIKKDKRILKKLQRFPLNILLTE